MSGGSAFPITTSTTFENVRKQSWRSFAPPNPAITNPELANMPNDSKHSPKYSWQFDPLDDSGRVKVTCGEVAVAEVASLRSATTLCRMLNTHADLLAALEALAGRDNPIEAILFGEYPDAAPLTFTVPIGALRRARAAIAKAKEQP